ncbi:MAG: SURF1 family protein [Steroidobacteraceae bacterium]
MTLRFAPRWYFVLLTAAVVPLFVSLGFWQWHRGEYRSAQWNAFARADVPAIESSAATLARLPRFTRVRVSGEFDNARQFLLDNISHNGAPGYEVLSLLRLADGSHLLVNRGWVPFTGYRDRLPDVTLAAAGQQRITGRLSSLPVAGMVSGQQAPADGAWPRVTSFPTREQLQQALGTPLLTPVLLLDAESGPGYLRDWQPPGIPPERNYGYAIQWWSFALLALIMFIGFNLKRRNV